MHDITVIGEDEMVVTRWPNEIFFKDLGLRKPDVFLNVDASSLGRVLGNILISIEPVLDEHRPDALR
ncbi:MAG: hypothetical protein KFB96_05945 [Thiocapsa sp.]|uniref:hypothetical protein n=1 Tax=Thiocapsa sp. TaxID=2024551 RepID=UPI001BCC6D1E|nr:hypothetical protein [Thiocapsa sp.]QVL50012.1 MAG: hypothetical protein KFB96_05945 [Thiocapsa sp.]